MTQHKIYIGTSGWHYQHWVGTFYPDDIRAHEHMGYYQEFFHTVEVNNSFYILPSKKTFEDWRKSVPDNFIFSVKASRYITHVKKLKDPEGTAKFLEHVKALKEKLGPVVFQLPPGWKVNPERLKEFLEYLPSKYRYVFEFRNPSWYDERIYELLRKHHCTFCIYEQDPASLSLLTTTDFVYVRLHGPAKQNSGSYTDKDLKQWAKRCQAWTEEKKDVYIYFDNDEAGYAAFNAQRLQELLELA